MERLAVGILAHVDAGKTTLSEGILYTAGVLRKMGRVDHQNAFLDTKAIERARGITIFSKQAVFPLGDRQITLLDTPGHVDFSAEMERTLQVMDYAVLVISGADGVQGHTQTLWRLLKMYHIPTFLFINKMDQAGTDRDFLINSLRNRLSEGIIAFDAQSGCRKREEDWLEDLALTDETVLEDFMESGEISDDQIRDLIRQRKVFPAYFGSALQLTGVKDLLAGLDEFMEDPEKTDEDISQEGPGSLAVGDKEGDGPDSYGARVFKISRDDKGERLTWLKVTGGRIRVKMPLADGEKINQIRIYSGEKFEMVKEADRGTVCAVTGLVSSFAGQGMGREKGGDIPLLEPVITCQILFPDQVDMQKTLRQLRELEEEEPLLHLVWEERKQELYAQLMGEVQIEILKSLIEERFGLIVEFGPGHILYRETISGPVHGVGHYEPLRHYAEVHLRLDPLPEGSGLEFVSECSEDDLDRNWQRLIMTHLREKEHLGTLTGSPATDIRYVLTAGRAHKKHTEGGDFRQATYRAVRQGLQCARAQGKAVLLEPWYSFVLEVPSDRIGRAMADIQRMGGSFGEAEAAQESDMLVLRGTAPAAELLGYNTDLLSYSGGKGRLSCALKGYEPCHNEEEVIESLAYDSEADLDHPAGSVFCAHGAGFMVPWDQVEEYMHIKDRARIWGPGGRSEPGVFPPFAQGPEQGAAGDWNAGAGTGGGNHPGNWEGDQSSPGLPAYYVEDEAFKAIYDREFGQGKQKDDHYSGFRTGNSKKRGAGSGFRDGSGSGIYSARRSQDSRAFSGMAGSRQTGRCQGQGREKYPARASGNKEYLLVDGYNIIFAWEDLSRLAEKNLDAARGRLIDIMCNYQGFVGCTLILVFDAYKVKGSKGQVLKYHNIYVVYTKEAETADQYIEKTTHEIVSKYAVRVATSDSLEQVIVTGAGALKVAADDFREEVMYIEEEIRRINREKRDRNKNYLFDQADAQTADKLEEVRLGRDSFEEADPDRQEPER